MLKVIFMKETRLNGKHYDVKAVAELSTAEAEFVISLGRAKKAEETPKKVKSAKKKTDETA